MHAFISRRETPPQPWHISRSVGMGARMVSSAKGPLSEQTRCPPSVHTLCLGFFLDIFCCCHLLSSIYPTRRMGEISGNVNRLLDTK
jgi:hypothetical protein